MKWFAILLVVIASSASGAEWRSLTQFDNGSANEDPLAIDYLLVLEQHLVPDIYIAPATQLIASFAALSQAVPGASWELHAPTKSDSPYILKSTFEATSPISKPRTTVRPLNLETVNLIREIWLNVVREARFGVPAGIIHGTEFRFEVIDPKLGQISAYTVLEDTARPPGMIVAAGHAVLAYAESNDELTLRNRLVFVRERLVEYHERRSARPSNPSLERP